MRNGCNEGIWPGMALLNGYEGIVNVALIHANRLAFGWTEGCLLYTSDAADE